MNAHNAIHNVFNNRDLRNHIFQYKQQLDNIEKCKKIYIKWECNGVETFIYTMPFGSHHKCTKFVRWSHVYYEDGNINENPLLVSDWVHSRKKRKTGIPKKRLGVYFDWMVDDSHIKEKEYDWYIHEFDRQDASEFDLSMHHLMSRQYKTLQTMIIHASVEKELLHRMYVQRY